MTTRQKRGMIQGKKKFCHVLSSRNKECFAIIFQSSFLLWTERAIIYITLQIIICWCLLSSWKSWLTFIWVTLICKYERNYRVRETWWTKPLPVTSKCSHQWCWFCQMLQQHAWLDWEMEGLLSEWNISNISVNITQNAKIILVWDVSFFLYCHDLIEIVN